MNVTITFKNKVESYYTRADGSAALSKDVLELVGDIVALVEQPRAQDAGDLLVERFLEPAGGSPGLDQHPLPALDRPTFRQVAVQGRIGR